MKLTFVLSFLALTVPQSQANEEASPGAKDADLLPGEKIPDCGLYLAMSSTSTAQEPRWGLYAGAKILKGSPIGYGEVAIQAFQPSANALREDVKDSKNKLVEIVEFVEQYIWVPHSSGGQFELDNAGKIVTAIPGVGVLGGYNPKITNADWNHSFAYRRPAWGEEAGVAHPGRGASSSYFEATLSATETIPVGMEIFVNYGDNWEQEEEDDDKEDNITLEDYKKIDETMDKMIEFFAKYDADLDPQSKQEIYQFLIQDVLYAAAGVKKGKAISALLPESPDKLKKVQDNGGSFKLLFPKTARSLPWLVKHGICIDNIRPGPSTIPHAGRGAFATRYIKAGSTVAPVPLIHIGDAEVMNMHPLVSKKDEDGEQYFVRKKGSKAFGKQLLLNYCLGHPESRLLFLPAGAATSFINHSPEPNAKLIWSDHPNNHLHWFDSKPMSLHGDAYQHLGLIMEVVATKDIAEGEEVTIDYGPEWVVAWKEHVAKWEAKAQSGDTWPVRALDYNNMFADKPIPLNAKEYPDNLMLKCFLLVKKPTDEAAVNGNGDNVRHWTDTPQTMQSENLFNCALVDVREITTPEGTTSWNYTVRLNSKRETWIKQVPHKAFVFVDKPSTSDQHIADAFRHYIGIPDEIFPKGPWRNIDDEVESVEEEEESDDDED